ncbi:cobyrinate a,c-diamide synthase [Nocardioides insulae]|uniref:cobyrinate a,c-diamide synthase n=1 Tax=Nocardioides insulae TaxID=394734 RepID=UPI0012FC992D|nr:cobyrinate a,c-diamide synthase [Nocardioides insulae]
MTVLPRLVVAAPASGHGKTTVATGLMAALAARGLRVSPHKVGPDYIDPGYHALATGRPGRNLDPFLVGEHRVTPLLLHGARTADLAVIEGVMGLYDGRLGTGGEASTAHVAALTDSPVILVVDVSHAARTHAAAVAGLASFDRRIRIGGVVLNRAGSARHADEVGSAIRDLGIPVLGSVPRDADLHTPSRHLGLIPAAERASSTDLVTRLAEVVTRHVDLDAVLDLGRSAPPLDTPRWDPVAEIALPPTSTAAVVPPAECVDAGPAVTTPTGILPTAEAPGAPRPVVAIASGPAFTFGYAEHTELLRAAGCEPVLFDPLTARSLPEGTVGLILGGGFPEEYAARLAANTGLLEALRDAILAGLPTTAECAGMLALCRSLDGHPMAGVLDATAAMSPRLTLGYREATALTDSPLAPGGTRVHGHEFHRTRVVPGDHSRHGTAWRLPGGPEGFAGPTLHASYLHLHPAGHPDTVASFARTVHQWVARPAGVHLHPVESVLPDRRVGPPGPSSRSSRTVESVLPDRRVGPPRPSSRSSRTVESDLTDRRIGPPGPSESVPPAAPASRGPADPLRHHGDRETGAGLLDFAVNVYAGPRPRWLDQALLASLDEAARYPDPGRARDAIAARHGRPPAEVLPTAGAAEAFTLVARLRRWQRAVVVHPQFTEPHAALEQAGTAVTPVHCREEDGFALDPGLVPDDADLVVIGNPTNPTGVLHPAETIRGLLRPGRVVLVDEAFLDAVPGESESLAGERADGLLVSRSLTKHWSIPGIRAGYLLGDPDLLADAERGQTPWSVSSTALAAMVVCSGETAAAEGRRRAETLTGWRVDLAAALTARGIPVVAGVAPFVLARVGPHAHAQLRGLGVAVRRADTFPGLDGNWVRIAARPPEQVAVLLAALDRLPSSASSSRTVGVRGASRRIGSTAPDAHVGATGEPTQPSARADSTTRDARLDDPRGPTQPSGKPDSTVREERVGG